MYLSSNISLHLTREKEQPALQNNSQPKKHSHFSLTHRNTGAPLPKEIRTQQSNIEDLVNSEPSIWEIINPLIFKRILMHVNEKDYKHINLVSKRWQHMLVKYT